VHHVPRHAARRQSLGANAARYRDRRSTRLDRRRGDGVHNKFGLPVGDMPIYALKKIGSDDLKFVTDPGRALASGKWKDIGRFKGPILRGLAGRAPYFHNGSAASLIDVVSFYDVRFSLGLTDQQKADLVAFLRTL
jgi:cytochrome c peroxidase